MLKYLLPASSVLISSFAPTHSATTDIVASPATTSQQLGGTPDVTDAAMPDSAPAAHEPTDQPQDADDSSQRAGPDASDVAGTPDRADRHPDGPTEDVADLAQDGEAPGGSMFQLTASLPGHVAGRMFTASTGDSAGSSAADMADLPNFDPSGSWMVPEITLPGSTSPGSTDPEPIDPDTPDPDSSDPDASDPWGTTPSLLPPDVPNGDQSGDQEEIPDPRPPVQAPSDVIDVPEPAGLGLIILGIGGLAAARRRRAA